MAWLYLIIAGLLEADWAIGLKYTAGFTRLWPSVFTTVAMIASIVFLAQALKAIPVGTGYVLWTGIDAVGTAVLGIALFSESANPGR
jgi:quaternary ammonium compound-resistance protein SugE